ncbi:MAG: hypothetical protein MK137_03200 [Rickettsiales bacterium]|nr:hypothetical protein [Rickettsiales bacterium]
MKSKIVVVFALVILAAVGYVMFQHNKLNEQKNIIIADIERLNQNPFRAAIKYESIDTKSSLGKEGSIVLLNPEVVFNNGNKLSFKGEMLLKRGSNSIETDFSGIISLIQRDQEVGVVNVSDSFSFAMETNIPLDEVTANNFYMNYKSVSMGMGSFEYQDMLKATPVKLDGKTNLVLTENSISYDVIGAMTVLNKFDGESFQIVAKDKPYTINLELSEAFKDVAGSVMMGQQPAVSASFSMDSGFLNILAGDGSELFSAKEMLFALAMESKDTDVAMKLTTKMDDYIVYNPSVQAAFDKMAEVGVEIDEASKKILVATPTDFEAELSIKGSGKKGTLPKIDFEDISIDLSKFYVSNDYSIANMNFVLDHNESKQGESETRIAQKLDSDILKKDVDAFKHLGCLMINMYNHELGYQELPDEAIVKLCSKAEGLGDLLYNVADFDIDYDVTVNGIKRKGRNNPEDLSFNFVKGLLAHQLKGSTFSVDLTGVDSQSDLNNYVFKMTDYKTYIGEIFNSWNSVIAFVNDYRTVSEEHNIEVLQDIEMLSTLSLSDTLKDNMFLFVKKISDQPDNSDAGVTITVSHKGSIHERNSDNITVGTLNVGEVDQLFAEMVEPHLPGAQQ